jgi:hypothetical protein
LLRAYVGKQQIDEALEAMDQMEGAGGSDNAQVYIELGQELEKEIERLKVAGETEQLAEVRSSFEKFLNELFQRKEGQAYNSLIWIAETYYSLGQGMDEKTAATDYFSKAGSAYEDIIGRNLIQGNGLAGVKLRLANCRRAQGEYNQALGLVTEMLKANANSLPAQFAAAKILQSWGNDGRPTALLDSINGREVDGQKLIWGWAGIAQRLSAIQANGNDSEQIAEKYLEANFHAFDSRRQYGLTQSGAGKDKALEAARQEIEVFVAIAGDLNPNAWNELDALYRQIQADRGIRPQDPLQKPAKVTIVKPPSVQPQTTKQAVRVATKPVGSDGVAETGGTNYFLIGLAFLVAAAVGVGTFMMMLKPQKRTAYAHSASAVFKAPPTRGTTSSAAAVVRTQETRRTATSGQPARRKAPARSPRQRTAPGQASTKKRVAKPRPADAAERHQQPVPKKMVRMGVPSPDPSGQPYKKKRTRPQPPQEDA